MLEYEEITHHFDYNGKSNVTCSQSRFILEYESEFTFSSLKLCGLYDSAKIYGGVKTRYEFASNKVRLVDSNNY